MTPLPDPPATVDLTPLGGGSPTAPNTVEIPGSAPSPGVPATVPPYPPASVSAAERFVAQLLALPEELRNQVAAALGAGGGDLTGAVRYDQAQALDAGEATQARTNIGAAAAATATTLESAIAALVPAPPTPIASDAAKLAYSPTINERITLIAEAQRIERFIGNVSDPNKFFVQGVPLIDLDVGGPNEVLGLKLDGFYLTDQGVASRPHAGEEVTTIIYGSSGNWAWEVNGFGAPVLYTSTDECDHISQVQNWTPSIEGLPAMTAFVQWDNSGVVVDGTPFIPTGTFNNEYPRYEDPSQNGLSVDGGGSWNGEGIGPITRTKPYPWLDGIGARSASTNQQNWIVERNTVNLWVENSLGAVITINGVPVANGVTSEVGWVDPSAIAVSGYAAYVVGLVVNGTEVNLNFYTAGDILSIIAALPPRAFVLIYLLD